MLIRKVKDNLFLASVILFTIFSILPLLFLVFYLLVEGASSLSLDLFTEIPKAVGESGGGIANGIVGTLNLILIASILGIPIGIAVGIFLYENKHSRFADMVRLAAEVLQGIPSIVIGIFAYALIVRPLGQYSAISAGIALSIMMLPYISRTTEEMMNLIHPSLKEAALALGTSHWRTTIFVVLRSAISGVITGIIIAIARIAGETAPLLFTTFGNQFFSMNIASPMAAMPLQIYNFAMSPYPSWHKLAWAASIILVAIVIVLNIISKMIVHRLSNKRG